MVTVQRRQTNRIVTIKNDVGDWLDDDQVIVDCFKRFYLELFKSKGPGDFQDALQVVDCVISDDENWKLCRSVSNLEIRNDAFQLGKDKAPGLMVSLGSSFKVLRITSRSRLRVWLLVSLIGIALLRR